jgi:redox-sensitive bicupin YhaK (pirin superfamily)
MKEGAAYEHVIPKGWNAMIVCYDGELFVQDDEDERLKVGWGSVFELSSESDERINFHSLSPDTKFILVAGKPLKEPIAWHGPFVLSSDDEIH